MHGSDGLAALEARDDEPAAVALILNLVQGTDMDVALDWVTNINGLLDSLMATHAPPQAKDVLSRVAVSVRQSSPGGPPQLVFGAYLRTDPVAMALEQAQASGSAPPGAQELADIFGEHGLEMLSRFCVEANLGTSAAAGLGIEESPVEHGGMHAGLSLELSRSALMGVAKALTALSSALPPPMRRLLPIPMRDIVSVFKAALALRKVDVDFDVPLDFTQQLFKMLTRRSTALPPGIVGKLYGEWETKTRSAEYMQKRFCSMMPGMAFHAMMEEVAHELPRMLQGAPRDKVAACSSFLQALFSPQVGLFPSASCLEQDIGVERLAVPPPAMDTSALQWTAWHALWLVRHVDTVEGIHASVQGTTLSVALPGIALGTLRDACTAGARRALVRGRRLEGEKEDMVQREVIVAGSHWTLLSQLAPACIALNRYPFAPGLGQTTRVQAVPGMLRSLGSPKELTGFASTELPAAELQGAALAELQALAQGGQAWRQVFGVALIVDVTSTESVADTAAQVEALRGADPTHALPVVVLADISGAKAWDAHLQRDFVTLQNVHDASMEHMPSKEELLADLGLAAGGPIASAQVVFVNGLHGLNITHAFSQLGIAGMAQAEETDEGWQDIMEEMCRA